MITNIDWITPIGSGYLRNNRSTKQKSLRCFPTCSVKGHVEGGFCGQALKVRIQFNPNPDSNLGNYCNQGSNRHVKATDFLFVAQMRPDTSSMSSSSNPSSTCTTSAYNELTFMDDEVFSKPNENNNSNMFILSNQKSILMPDLCSRLRNRNESKTKAEAAELYLGLVEVNKEGEDLFDLDVIFNMNLHSWDYSWKSDRWNSKLGHYIDIIALRYGAQELIVSDFKSSTPFQISSSHKKSNQKKSSSSSDENDDKDSNLPSEFCSIIKSNQSEVKSDNGTTEVKAKRKYIKKKDKIIKNDVYSSCSSISTSPSTTTSSSPLAGPIPTNVPPNLYVPQVINFNYGEQPFKRNNAPISLSSSTTLPISLLPSQFIQSSQYQNPVNHYSYLDENNKDLTIKNIHSIDHSIPNTNNIVTLSKSIDSESKVNCPYLVPTLARSFSGDNVVVTNISQSSNCLSSTDDIYNLLKSNDLDAQSIHSLFSSNHLSTVSISSPPSPISRRLTEFNINTTSPVKSSF